MVTEDEVNDYTGHLLAHLPREHSHLGVEQVRAVLDAEAAYFERRFGSVRGWRALLRAIFGRGDPTPVMIEQERAAFEEFTARMLAHRGDLDREDIRAIMAAEDEAGPLWSPPPSPDLT